MNSNNSSLFQQEYRVLEYLAALSYRDGDLGSYLNQIARGVSLLIESDWSIVTVFEGDAGRIVASSLDLDDDERGFALHGSLVDEITQTGRSLIIEDIRQEVRQTKPSAEYLCYMGIPLRTFTGEAIGTICSFLRQPRQFTESEVSAVELFAERAATAIDNYRLYQQQQQFNTRLEQEVSACTIDLLASQEKSIERERLAAIGEFTATIVHEIRNPLTTMMMGLNHAHKQLVAETDRERLALAIDESHRLKRLLDEILLYAKPQVLQLTKIEIGTFLSNLNRQFQAMPEAIDRQISFTNISPDIEIMADVDKLKQVFINLVRNAFEAIDPHQTVELEIVRFVNPDRVKIDIRNGGEPIPPELIPQLTTPFYSTKSSGTGLGLAIVQRIVIAHDGELSKLARRLTTIDSSSSGTTVSVSLPIDC